MKKLLKYLQDYRKESVLAPLFKMLEALLELFVPLVMAAVIDVGIRQKDVPYIVRMCILLVVLGIVGLVCSVTAQYFSAKAAVGFGSSLRYALFSHIQKFSYAQQDQIGTSTLITRMTSDINQVQSMVNMVLRLFLRSPFIVFGAMVMAFTIDVKSALIFAVTIPLLAAVVFGIMLICIPLYKKVQAYLDQVLLTTRENLTGVRVLRAFSMEQREKDKFAGENQLLTSQQFKVGRISALLNPLTYVMINLATAWLIWKGAFAVDTGRISQGEAVALVNYMSQILVELIKLANLIMSVTKAFACADRVAKIMDIQTGEPQSRGHKVSDLSAKGDDLVKMDTVSFSYPLSRENALSGISFSARKGEVIGILGGTGSGKSTLIQLIPGFYEHSGGTLELFGLDSRELDDLQRRNQIGIVPQKAVLFKGTIRSNLLWGNPGADDEALMDALRQAQALSVLEGKENGLDSLVEQGGKNFSGGQRQRLTIARALVRKPQILILDDSFSALDYVTESKLRKEIHQIENRPLIFIVSQRASSVLGADRILVLDNGELTGYGSHQELIRTCSVYQEIYECQFPEDTKGTGGIAE